MLRHFWIGTALFCSLLSTASGNTDYLQELIKQSEIKGLAQHPEWRALLHYKDNLLFPGVTSEVDGAEFFNDRIESRSVEPS